MTAVTAGRSSLPTLVRFGLTGCAGFAVDFAALFLLHSVLGAPLATATLVAYFTGGIVHYSLTRCWVFPQGASGGEVGRIARYVTLSGLNALATLGMVTGLVHVGADYLVAKGVAVGVLFATNYLLTPRFVMRGPGSRTSPATDAVVPETSLAPSS